MTHSASHTNKRAVPPHRAAPETNRFRPIGERPRDGSVVHAWRVATRPDLLGQGCITLSRTMVWLQEAEPSAESRSMRSDGPRENGLRGSVPGLAVRAHATTSQCSGWSFSKLNRNPLRCRGQCGSGIDRAVQSIASKGGLRTVRPSPFRTGIVGPAIPRFGADDTQPDGGDAGRIVQISVARPSPELFLSVPTSTDHVSHAQDQGLVP